MLYPGELAEKACQEQRKRGKEKSRARAYQTMKRKGERLNQPNSYLYGSAKLVKMISIPVLYATNIHSR